MTTVIATGESDRSRYVSTGRLPPPERVTTLVAEAHKRFKSNAEGENSTVYPALAPVPSDLFGCAWSAPTATSIRWGTQNMTLLS